MIDDVHKLRKRYRAIKAPGHLRNKIHARVSEEPAHPNYWMPATASILAVAVVIGILPFVLQPQPPHVVSEKPSKPSLSALASMLPEKPGGAPTSLSRLRSVKVPKMPAKPKASRPQANSPYEDELLKEKDHAHS